MPAKPDGLVSTSGENALRALGSRQCRDQRHRVIGQRRGAHRIGCRTWRGSGRRNCGSRTDRARHKARPASAGAANTRGLSHRPVPSSWMFFKLAPAAVSASAIATTESPSSAMNSASAVAERLRHGARRARRDRRRIFRNADDAAALAADGLLEGGLHHIAIGIVGQQRGEGSLADAGGIVDDPVDVGFRQEAQEIDAAAGDARIGRERDHRYAAGAGQLRRRRNRQREQRAEDDLGAFVERLLRALLRALRAAAVVLDQKLDVRDSGIPPAPSRRRSSSTARRRRHCRMPTAAGSGRP